MSSVAIYLLIDTRIFFFRRTVKVHNFMTFVIEKNTITADRFPDYEFFYPMAAAGGPMDYDFAFDLGGKYT